MVAWATPLLTLGLCLALVLIVSGSARADSGVLGLMQAFELARDNDPVFRGARAEQQAGGKADHSAHHQPPPTALTIATVAKPVAMKVNVATMDRFDRRDMPHTP